MKSPCEHHDRDRDRDNDAEDSYQTPHENDNEHDRDEEMDNDNDNVAATSSDATATMDLSVVQEASRNLTNLLRDMLEELNTMTDASVTLSGELKISIGEHQTYALSLKEAVDPSEALELKILLAGAPTTTSAESGSSGNRKRAIHPTAEHERDDSSSSPAAKRAKPNGDVDGTERRPSSQNASMLTAAARAADGLMQDNLYPDPALHTTDDEPLDLTKEIRALSKQVRWVEDCRRTAATRYHSREERWRTTSATFHDQNRLKRERHEAWLAGEMARQTNMLAQVVNDVKGLYPLLHSVKWETPAAVPHPLYPVPNPQAPMPHPYTSPHTAIPIPRASNGTGHGTPPTRGRPRGRPRGSTRS